MFLNERLSLPLPSAVSCFSGQVAHTLGDMNGRKGREHPCELSSCHNLTRHDSGRFPSFLWASLSSSLKVKIIMSMLAGHDFVWIISAQEVIILSYSIPHRFWMALLLETLLWEITVSKGPRKPELLFLPLLCVTLEIWGSLGKAGLGDHLCETTGAMNHRQGWEMLGSSDLSPRTWFQTSLQGDDKDSHLFYICCGGGKEEYPQIMAGEEEEFPEVDANSFLPESELGQCIRAMWLGDGSFLPGAHMNARVHMLAWSLFELFHLCESSPHLWETIGLVYFNLLCGRHTRARLLYLLVGSLRSSVVVLEPGCHQNLGANKNPLESLIRSPWEQTNRLKKRWTQNPDF